MRARPTGAPTLSLAKHFQKARKSPQAGDVRHSSALRLLAEGTYLLNQASNASAFVNACANEELRLKPSANMACATSSSSPDPANCCFHSSVAMVSNKSKEGAKSESTKDTVAKCRCRRQWPQQGKKPNWGARMANARAAQPC